MPILVFTTNFPKLRSKDRADWKRQSIRKNLAYWLSAHKRGNDLHVWLGSPRVNRDAEKLGIVANLNWLVQPCRGADFTVEIAQADGFATIRDLDTVLGRMHRMSWGQVSGHEWALIRFAFPGEPQPSPAAIPQGGSMRMPKGY